MARERAPQKTFVEQYGIGYAEFPGRAHADQPSPRIGLIEPVKPIRRPFRRAGLQSMTRRGDGGLGFAGW